MPIASDRDSDWLNTRLARSCCRAPTACETSATVPTFRIWVSASTMNQTLPADVTPAMDWSPSFDTKYRSVKKYRVCTRMPMAICMDIVAMCLGMDPALRSFIRSIMRDAQNKKAGLVDRPSRNRGVEPYLLQGTVVMIPMRPRGSLLPTSPVTFDPLLALASVPVNLANTVKLPNV